MLGKGLESLIPQKGNQNAGGNNINGMPAPSAHMLPTGVGQGAADLDPADELPAAPAPREFPGISTSEELPPVILSEPARPVFQSWTKPNPAMQSDPQPQRQVFQQPSPVQPKSPVVKRDEPIKREESAPQSIFHIEVEKIAPNPGQPRRVFNDEALQDLARSIREFGFLQPIVVTKVEKETPAGIDVEYQLIAGERRLKAAKLLGLRIVPAIIRNVKLEREKVELAVIENIQRENLNPVETARAFQRLQEEFRMTQREIAAKLGKSREVVANTVRLLDLPDYIQQALQKGELSESHARLLLGMTDPGGQKRLFEEIIQNRLTTRDVKERVKSVSKRAYHHHVVDESLPAEVKAMQEMLSMSLGAPVEIHKGANTGKITITFYSAEELENIMRRLGEKEV